VRSTAVGARHPLADRGCAGANEKTMTEGLRPNCSTLEQPGQRSQVREDVHKMAEATARSRTIAGNGDPNGFQGRPMPRQHASRLPQLRYHGAYRRRQTRPRAHPVLHGKSYSSADPRGRRDMDWMARSRARHHITPPPPPRSGTAGLTSSTPRPRRFHHRGRAFASRARRRGGACGLTRASSADRAVWRQATSTKVPASSSAKDG